jgi:type IV secretory pathway TraG/TraD family ATPase VirD4
MTPSRGSVTARRYASLALWAAVLMAPSVPVAAALLAAGAAALVGPAAWRALARAPGRGRATPDRVGDRIALGVDSAGRQVTLSDSQLAAHALIVGGSGAGKSTTMLAMLGAEIRLGRPVVAIDMKGSPAFAAELRHAARAAGRELRVWTPDGPSQWNPLAHGNATALKDMLISTERFSEPHYQRAAERYVQTALQVLHAAHPDRPARLDEVVAVMEPRRLAMLLRRVPAPLAERVQDYLGGLTTDQLSAARGLGTRLALLSESSAGQFLRGGDARPGMTVDLRAGLEGGDVILLSLNANVYGKLAAQLGALAIQDLISASGDRLRPNAATGPAGSAGPAGPAGPAGSAGPVPATVGIDEFSALGTDNVLALVARGREPGVRVLLATQEMADLERAGRGFRDQVLGIVGIKIIHRQDVPASAEMVAQMAGTERAWEETEYIRGVFAGTGGNRGTRRLADRYIVHPNEIKTLPVGTAVVLTKLPTADAQRVRVAPDRGRDHPGRDGPGRDQRGRDGPAR